MSECQIPNGCLMHEVTGACPLCHEDGADRIAEHVSDWRTNDENGHLWDGPEVAQCAPVFRS